jgi:hypothetical protein
LIDLDGDRRAGHAVSAQPGARARGIQDGVVQQIDDGAHEQRRIHRRPRRKVALHDDRLAGFFQRSVREIRPSCRPLPAMHVSASSRGRFAAVGPRQEQHVVDDAAQALQFFQVRLHHFLEFAGIARPGKRHLGHADQVAERRAQFMRHVRIEGLRLPVGLLEAVERAVDGAVTLVSSGAGGPRPGVATGWPRSAAGLVGQLQQGPQADAHHDMAERIRDRHGAAADSTPSAIARNTRRASAKGMRIDADGQRHGRALAVGLEVPGQHVERVFLAGHRNQAHAAMAGALRAAGSRPVP